MQIDIKDVHVGDKVWATDYRRDTDAGIFGKPTRAIRPAQFLVVSNTDTKEIVYYSNWHLRELKKDGTPYSKVVKPYDNTGYRHYTGVPLKFFDNREECVKFFNGQIKGLIKKVEVWKRDSHTKADTMIDQFNSELI